MRLRDVLLKEKADIVISMFDYDFDILCDVEDGSSKNFRVSFFSRGKNDRSAFMVETNDTIHETKKLVENNSKV